MKDKLDSYSAILTSLVSEAISCSPESWSEGSLTVECDGSYLSYKLKNANSPDKAEISDALRGLCEEFYVVMRKAGDIWHTAVVHFFRKDQGWSFDVNFQYPDSSTKSAPTARPETRKKSMWKFWQ